MSTLCTEDGCAIDCVCQSFHPSYISTICSRQDLHTLLFQLPDQLQSPAISGMMAHTIFRYDNSKRVKYISHYIFLHSQKYPSSIRDMGCGTILVIRESCLCSTCCSQHKAYLGYQLVQSPTDHKSECVHRLRKQAICI